MGRRVGDAAKYAMVRGGDLFVVEPGEGEKTQIRTREKCQRREGVRKKPRHGLLLVGLLPKQGTEER